MGHNMGEFIYSSLAGVGLVPVVMALVEWTKRLGVTGKWLYVASMGIGLVLGGLHQYAYLSGPDPLTIQQGLGILVYGLTLGLAASGLYDVAGGLLEKAVSVRHDGP